jgi:transcription termination factor Rho
MRLSDFKDEKAIEVIADLLIPISNIAKNSTVAESRGKSMFEFAAAMLKENASDVKDMLAILNDEDPEEYTCSAASVFGDVLEMFNDPELMQLFGVRSKTPASAGSASETIEAQEE